MPVELRTDRGDLRLMAGTLQEATRVAIMMIVSRDAFDVGDALTHRRADYGPDATIAIGDRR
jgi:hypothetical protein